MRDTQFPGVFEVDSGVYGLMYFNAWGNVLAPLMGMLVAQGLATDTMRSLPFPLERAEPVARPQKQAWLIRDILIPLARTAQILGMTTDASKSISERPAGAPVFAKCRICWLLRHDGLAVGATKPDGRRYPSAKPKQR
jgi:hypothetical protein